MAGKELIFDTGKAAQKKNKKIKQDIVNLMCLRDVNLLNYCRVKKNKKTITLII